MTIEETFDLESFYDELTYKCIVKILSSLWRDLKTFFSFILCINSQENEELMTKE